MQVGSWHAVCGVLLLDTWRCSRTGVGATTAQGGAWRDSGGARALPLLPQHIIRAGTGTAAPAAAVARRSRRRWTHARTHTRREPACDAVRALGCSWAQARQGLRHRHRPGEPGSAGLRSAVSLATCRWGRHPATQRRGSQSPPRTHTHAHAHAHVHVPVPAHAGVAEAQSYGSAVLRLLSTSEELRGQLMAAGVVRHVLPLLEARVAAARWNARQVGPPPVGSNQPTGRFWWFTKAS